MSHSGRAVYAAQHEPEAMTPTQRAFAEAGVPALNGPIYTEAPPQRIAAALEAVVVADRGLWVDRQVMQRCSTAETRSQVVHSADQLDEVMEYATRALEDFLGGRPTGYWPIAGRLVGFSPASKYGMTLAVKPDRCTLKVK